MNVQVDGKTSVGTSNPDHAFHVIGVSKIGDNVGQSAPSGTDIRSTSHVIMGGYGGNGLYLGQYPWFFKAMQHGYSLPTLFPRHWFTYDIGTFQPLGLKVPIGGTDTSSYMLKLKNMEVTGGDAISS